VIVGGKEKAIMTMTIQSSSFHHNGEIPFRHTCDGQNISPALSWTGVPAGTKSLALIVDDPDAPDPSAPRMIWVHWVLYNIPAGTKGLPESVAAKDLPSGVLQGTNDWQHTGYEGPCPPVGSHRYYHKLFALDVVLPDLKHPTKAALEKAMQGHIIARSSLIGLYRRH
jgi:Raf kinase inhibitor-like YbhB/YbcL family protein